MSLQFSDTSTYKGLVQVYEREIGAELGFVANNTQRLAEVTAELNLAYDDFLVLALQASGTWQYDDSNHTDQPIIKTNIVSGQRDYSFTSDENSNLVLDIYKVTVADTNGIYNEITPIDVQSEADTANFYDGQNTGGVPTKYDKTGNTITLDYVPNYNSTNGLKVYINREPSYFTTSDTTKKPGFPGVFHRYLALKAALTYARRNSRANYNALLFEVAKMEDDIKERFGQRTHDEVGRLIPSNESNA